MRLRPLDKYQFLVPLLFLVISGVYIVMALKLPGTASLLPLIAGAITLIGSALILLGHFCQPLKKFTVGDQVSPPEVDEDLITNRFLASSLRYLFPIAWATLLVVLLFVIGARLAVPIFTLAYFLKVDGVKAFPKAIIAAAVMLACEWYLFEYLVGAQFPTGIFNIG